MPVDPITSSGLKTHISSPVPSDGQTLYNITGGTRVGTNLFHSFGEFGVPNHTIANFLNTPVAGVMPSTSNILGRVTGGETSNILGTIQTTGFGNAKLFLMNPSGIVFGPTASLNVGGSVTFTTADYLRLGEIDGPTAGVFHADPARTTLLSSAPVDAFGFLTTSPGGIAIHGSQLVVHEKQAITLVGGNITSQSGMLQNGTIQPAHLLAPNGKISLATTQSPGEFFQDFTDGPNINDQLFASVGYIQLASGSRVDISHTSNGTVSIRGGQLILDIQNSVLSTIDNATTTPVPPEQDTILITPTSQIISGAYSDRDGPDIHLHADQLTLVGVPSTRDNFANKPRTQIQSYASGDHKAGDIILWTNNDIELNKLVTISSITTASGQAGNIELTSVHGNIRMTEGGKESPGVSSASIASGDTGNVTVSAPAGNIILSGVQVRTQTRPLNPLDPQQLAAATGRPGKVEINAKNLEMSAGTLGTFTTGSAKPGSITVKLSDTLTMTADSSLNLPSGGLPDSIIVASSVSRAPPGDIFITAKDIVASQKSIINSSSFASGAGGHLQINTDTLHVMDGTQISSGSTRAPSRGTLRSFVESLPTGTGGNITIHARDSVLVDGERSGIFADTEGTGAGGTINLSAKTLTIQNGGTISASTTGTDPLAIGGSIIINAMDQVLLTNGGTISASSIMKPQTSNSGIADAGSIFLNAGNQLEMHDRSSIKTTTESTQANGGNIDIRAIELIRLVNNSEITTSVKGAEGSGGNIFIDPKVILLQGSNVTAQAVGGTGGNITFVTPLFLADATSIVSASSQRGANGTVTIQSPTSNLSGAIGQLASKISQPQVLLQNRCAALIGGRESTFVLAGHHTVPPEPGDWLSPSASIEHWTGESPEHAFGLMVHSHGSSRPSPLARDKDKATVVSLRRLTPLGFLVRTFAAEPTGCPS